jgi:heterodisulfide reductase subunit A-like polyferredoxin
MRHISMLVGAKSVAKESEAVQQPPNADPLVTLEERSVDESRPLRVVIIGAGISGILSCIRFTQRIPNLDLCIYEKNADIGGTWLENRYPGCACGRSIPLIWG